VTVVRSARAEASRNERGSAEDRRRRKVWLIETYRANADHREPRLGESKTRGVPIGQGEPACRCFRCGELLTLETVTVDRIKPGCQGGTYRRNNIRPACGPCNTETGQAYAAAARARKGD
jgi:5-methylcytosine-specific restriction endonuclease McrA